MNIDQIIPVRKEHLLLMLVGCWLAPGIIILIRGLKALAQMFAGAYPAWQPWTLLLAAAAVFVAFYFMFSGFVRRYTQRILDFKEKRKSLLAFLNLKGYILIAFMIGLGISLKHIPGMPVEFFAGFYPGLGSALTLMGLRFARNWEKAMREDSTHDDNAPNKEPHKQVAKTEQKNWGLRLCFDRIVSNNIWGQFIILLVLFALLYGIAIGVAYLFDMNGHIPDQFKHINNLVWPLYLLIDSNSLNLIYSASGASNTAIVIACIIYLFGLILFSGMLIAFVSNFVNRSVENHKTGRTRYLAANHIVIMEYDDIVPSIVKQELEKESASYILILSKLPSETIYERLRETEAWQYRKRVIVNQGVITNINDYKEIKLERAKKIYIVGNSKTSAHDAKNIECLNMIASFLSDCKEKKTSQWEKGHPQKIACVFEELDTYRLCLTPGNGGKDRYEDYKDNSIPDFFWRIEQLGIIFEPFNFYVSWARRLFVPELETSKKSEYPLIGKSCLTKESKKHAHLVFVGTSNFAVSFAMEAAQMLHFPNFDGSTESRTHITFIDENADKEMRVFATRNRRLFEVQSHYYRDMTGGDTDDKEIVPTRFTGKDANFLDVDFHFVKGNVFDDNVQRLLQTWAQDERQELSIFLAMSDTEKNLTIGMNLPDEVYDSGTNIFIRQDHSCLFLDNIRAISNNILKKNWIDETGQLKERECKGRYVNVYPFGMRNMTSWLDETVHLRAKIINNLYQHEFKTDKSLSEIIKEAEDDWKKLIIPLRWSNIYLSYSIPLRAAIMRANRTDDSDPLGNFSDSEASLIEDLAKVEHNRWNIEKLLLGYRKALPHEDLYNYPSDKNKLKKNKERFIHHDLRAFQDLSDGAKEYDINITMKIPWLIEQLKTENKKPSNHE